MAVTYCRTVFCLCGIAVLKDFLCPVGISLRVSVLLSFKDALEERHIFRKNEALVYKSLCMLFANMIFVSLGSYFQNTPLQ